MVIGVHSAKFPAEKLTENIRAAVMRHGIEHPVVNDADFAVWSSYAVRAWPTVVVLDALGRVAAQHAGEIDADEMAPLIDELIAEAAGQDLLDPSPIPGLRPESAQAAETLLRFPSKLAMGTGDRLYVADTGHHRVLEVQLSEDGLAGEITRFFGTGEPGLQDGSARSAQFHDPHGMALVHPNLYVADTENHAVRAIDLVREQVRTVAGTGEKGRSLRVLGNEPTSMPLRSPWALVAVENVLLIAMAGSHQIWILIEEQTLGLFAGTGAEALVDGPRGEAAFNQPSDLAFAMQHLFVADAEAGAIRAISLSDEPQVMTLVGQGLFEFGDVDGVGQAVRLQHPTGLAAGNDLVYIADTYNHKIKTLDPTTGTVQTIAGNGEAGQDDGAAHSATFYEPEGLVLSEDGQRLYVADTNNHALRMVDLARAEVHTVELR